MQDTPQQSDNLHDTEALNEIARILVEQAEDDLATERGNEKYQSDKDHGSNNTTHA